MRITDISIQARNKDRVNISVDGRFRFSLDIFQVGELGIKVGNEFEEDELIELEQESQFGKLYARALEYTMLRPHSVKELRDYLWRKTRTKKVKNPHTGKVTDKLGVSEQIAERVLQRLIEKGYIDDEKFARYWIENRNQTKGSSLRKLTAELRIKGVAQSLIDEIIVESSRNDDSEIDKILLKKRNKYDDQKLMQYLVRQGFSYDLIRAKISEFPSVANEKDLQD